MAEKKVHRDAIPLATVKAIMVSNSGIKECRLGTSQHTKAGKRPSAASEARSALKAVLRKLASDCESALKLAKKSTVNVEILEHVVRESLSCKGVHASDLHVVKRKGVRMELPVAGVRRVFLDQKVKTGKDGKKKTSKSAVRLTADAELALVGVSIAYLNALANLAGQFAKAGKLQTIQASHVNAARQALELR